jgi:5-methylcytosine-specific restriction endonuclease McrA
MDNSKGYTVENSVPCCYRCNHAKRDYSYGEFVDWVKRAADHMNAKEISRLLVIGDK